MSCEQTAELLPWLLNGTLGEEEERQVRAHLETCDACRDELRQTRLIWSLAEGHLPAEALVDYAMGRPCANARRKLIESHVAHCSRCRGELELLRESPEPEVATMPDRRSSTPWARTWRRSEPSSRYLVLAATLTTLIAGAGWFWSTRHFAHERAIWNRQETELRARIEALSVPRLNTPVIELLPSTSEAVLRSATPAPDALVNEVTLPAGAAPVTLTLLSGRTEPAVDFTVEVMNGQGEVIWRRDGLVRSSASPFSLTFPADLLPRDRSTIQISRRDDRERVIRYEIRVTSQPV